MWHLSGTSAISLADSTANGNTLTKVGSVTVAPAQIAGGASFPGYYGQHLIAPNNTGLAPAQLSVSCWFQTPVSSAWQYAIDSNGDSNGFTFQLAPNDGGYYVTLGNVYTNIYSSKTFGGGVHYFTATYDGSTVRTYIDGVPDVSQAISGSPAIQWPANGPSFGSAYSGAQAFGYSGGLMEEVRWSPAALAAGWVATEYNNQKSPGTFFTITAEQGPATGYPSITVTVNVASNAASPQLNQVSVSGGGSAGASANDSTIIVAPVAMPAFSPPGGMYTSALSVSVSATTSGATIRYTTNGSTPSETAGTVYNTPITVSSTQTINAIAYESGYPDSAISSATYTISPVLTISSTHTGSFAQGQTGTYTVTVSDQSGAGPTVGTVTLTETLPTGLTLASMAGANWTCTIATATCTALSALQPGLSYSITATVNVASNAPPQVTNQVSISGGGSAPGADSDTTTIVAPFTLSISPQQQSVAPGGTASFTITTASSASGEPINLNWWNSTYGIIGFACQGYSGSFGITLPSTVTTGQQGVVATITMPVSSNFYNLQASPIFICNFSVTGGYGGLIATQWGQVSVTTAPYYSFAAPAPVTAAGSANFTLSVSSQNNFAGTVNFSGSVSSSCGITVSPTNPVVGLTSGGSGSTSMFVAVPPSCPAGNYPIAISSSSTSSPNNSPSQTAMLTLQATPQLTLSISPNPQPVIPGQSTSFTISAPSFASAVNLSLGPLTAGLSASLTSTTIAPGQSVTLNVSTSTSTPIATLPILVTGYSGSLSHAKSAVMSMTTGGSAIALPAVSTVPGGPPGMAYINPALEGDTVSSCSSAPANVSVAIVAGATAISLTAATTATATRTTIYCATTAGRNLTIALDINDAGGPQISSIQQGGLNSDGSISFTIQGTYFGDSPGTVTISTTGPNSGSPYATVMSWPGDDDGDGGEEDEATVWIYGLPTTCSGSNSFVYNLYLSAADPYLNDSEAENSFSYNPCSEYSPPPPTYTISGTITNLSGKAVQGIIITAANSTAPTASTATNANGQYSFTGLAACSTVTLSATFGYPYSIPITPVNPPPGGSFSCIQANQTENFTTANYTAVYLLHGINQGYSAMQPLAAELTTPGGPPGGLDLSRFYVDSGFDFSECAAKQACTQVTETPTLAAAAGSSLACSVSGGGQKLADYVNFHSASNPAQAPYLPATGASRIVLVGYSMGGLIARDLLINGYTQAYEGALNNYPVQGLVTLGTPNWGYPYLPADSGVLCPQLVEDMAGSWNTQTGGPNPLSVFLSSRDASPPWTASSYGSYWLAAAGRFCAVQARAPYTGCLEQNGVYSNDGVVCADSAEYSYSSSPGPTGKPTAVFDDPNDIYSHTNAASGLGTALVMGCATGPANSLLSIPPNQVTNSLFSQIVTVINQNGH